MDLRVFEKSPHIAPLLVRLYESHKLYSLARDKDPLAQAELTSAVADLLGVSLSAREQELLTDVLIALTRQAEKDLRRAVAERLSVMDTVPLRLALHLANDEIPVAEPMLRRSPVLSDLDLIYIIKSQGPEYWQAIAAREHLSPQVIDILADTKDTGTAVTLSENERIRLTTHAIDVLSEMAKRDEAVARPLLSRPEMPGDLARMLYAHVGQELKDWLRTAYGIGEDERVNDVFIEFAEAATRSEFMPTKPMAEAAKKLADLGMLNMQMMVDTLQRGQIPSFIAMFAKYTGIPAKRVHDFLTQPVPKGLAIACRAFGVQKADFSRMYLMTYRMRSQDRIVNHRDMLELLSYFDKARPEVARRIVTRGAESGGKPGGKPGTRA